MKKKNTCLVVLLAVAVSLVLALSWRSICRPKSVPEAPSPINEATVASYVKQQEGLPHEWPAKVTHERGMYVVTLVIPVTPGGPDHRGQYLVAEDGKILARFAAGRSGSLDEMLETVRQHEARKKQETRGRTSN